MRKISDALDPTEGLEADADLRAALDADPDAAAYARDLESIDGALRAMGSDRAEPDWDALFDRIEARLDEDVDLPDIGDVTAPPELAEDEAPTTSAERPVAAAAAASPVAESRPAEVVDLAARRRRRQLITAIGGLAAAAAVGLGITAGLSMNDGMAPASEAPIATAEPATPSADMAVEESTASAGDSAEAPAEEPAPMAFGYGSEDSDDADPEAMTAAGAAAPGAAPPAPRPTRTARTRAGSRGRAGPGYGVGSTSGAGGGGGAGLDDLATGGSRAMAPSSEPTRPQVMAAFATVTDAVQRCIGDTGEIARVHVRINGSTGRAESVRVSPPYTGTQAACIVRAVRGASLPRSQRPSYEATYAYRPAGPAAGSLQKNQPALRRQRRRPAARERDVDMLSPFEK